MSSNWLAVSAIWQTPWPLACCLCSAYAALVDAFEGFTLLAGTRAEASGGQPFICIQNRLSGGLHLFIAQEGARGGNPEGDTAGGGLAWPLLARPA